MMTPKTPKLQKSLSFATSWVGSLLLLFLFGCGGKNSGDDPSAVIEGNGFVILGTLTDQFDRAKAKANVEDTLSRHPDIDCMVGLFEYNPPLILEALEQADKIGSVKVVAFDENDRTLKGIQDGQRGGARLSDRTPTCTGTSRWNTWPVFTRAGSAKLAYVTNGVAPFGPLPKKE